MRGGFCLISFGLAVNIFISDRLLCFLLNAAKRKVGTNEVC